MERMKIMNFKIKRSIVLTIALSVCMTLLGPLAHVAANDVSTASVVEEDSSKITLDCAESANIFKNINWNFENGEYYWRLVNTIDNQASAYYYVMTVTDEKAYSGTSSLMLDGVGGWSNIVIPINVKKNTDYTFSMWVNASPGLGGMANTVWKIGAMEDYQPDAQIISLRSFYFTGDRGLGEYNGEWHQIGIVVNSGDNDVLSLIIADGGGLIYFDDLRFFETAAPNGTAATEVANLQKVIKKVQQENATPTPKPSPTTAPASSAAQSSQQTSTAVSEDVSDDVSADESVDESGEISEDGSEPEESGSEVSEETSNSETSSASLPEGGDEGSGNTTLIIIIIAAVVAAAGGAALWFFKFRKK